MKHAVITLASVTAALVALDMSSSTVTWANNSDGTLTYVEKTPEAGWNNVTQTLLPGQDNEDVPATLDASPMHGSLTYNIAVEGYNTGYNFDIVLEGGNCNTNDTMSCQPVDGSMAPNRLCGADGQGPTVFEVTATPTLETDNVTVTCNVDVQNLGDNENYVPYIEKLALDHIQFLNWNSSSPSSQRPAGMVETFSSPRCATDPTSTLCNHFIAVAEMAASQPTLIPGWGPQVQNIHIFEWDKTNKTFKHQTSWEPPSHSNYIGGMHFYTTLANQNVEYLQIGYTYGGSASDPRAGVSGKSYIWTYYFDYNNQKKFVPDTDRSNTDANFIRDRKGITDLHYFNSGNTSHLLVVEGGNQLAGFNQKAYVYNWNNDCSCFKNGDIKTTVGTWGAQSVDSYIDGSEYFLFANSHSQVSYNIGGQGGYKFTGSAFEAPVTKVTTYDAKDWAHFTVPEDPGYTYVVLINGLYDFTQTNPTTPSKESLVYKAQGSNMQLAHAIDDLPLNVRTWETVSLDGNNYFFLGYAKDPGEENRKNRAIYSWCTEAQSSQDGHWCKGMQGKHTYSYPGDNFTIPENSSAHPFTYDWKTIEIDGEHYVIRIDNTKTGGNSAQLLKVSLK